MIYNISMDFPALHGNWIDLLILAILLFFIAEGFFDRFISSVLNLLGFILTYGVALRFYGIAARIFIANFSLPHGIANALGFFATAVLAEGIYNIISSFAYRNIPKSIKASKWNRYLGVLPAFGNGLILTAFLLTLLVTLPTNPLLKKAVLDSKIGSALVLRSQAIEGQLNNVFGQAVNETLTFITVHPEPTSKENVDLKFQTSNVSVDSTSEDKMLTLVNQERTSRGVRALTSDGRLKELARTYAKDMFARGYFSHYNPEGQSPFDRMEKAGIQFTAAGENLAYAPNVDVAHTGLMNSPGHRANILSADFGRVGIGVIDGGIYGKMFVQEFTN